MSVEFYDCYSSNGFWFDSDATGRQFCLSSSGQKRRNCLTKFSGSLAIARYHIRFRSRTPDLIALREHVRTIDRDSRLSLRAPFERTLDVQGGVASDIQAFGYETDASVPDRVSAIQAHEPWCLLRQDLYFDKESAPFLVIHWKHTLSAISLLDVIPGEKTKLIDK
jgi:hypothetical protein